MPPHVAAELKRHTIPGGELEVGDAALEFGGLCRGLLETRRIKRRQPQEGGASRRRYVRRRGIDPEELRFIVLIKRHPAREAPRHARMAGKRTVLRLRQL